MGSCLYDDFPIDVLVIENKVLFRGRGGVSEGFSLVVNNTIQET